MESVQRQAKTRDGVGMIGRVLLGVTVIMAALAVVWWGTHAGGTEANIKVEASATVGPMPTPWRSLAQGGEAIETFLDSNSGSVAALSPRLIRVDHIYDMLASVNKSGSGLVVDWSKLDKTVEQIRKVGATPLLSLSYMPPAIARNGIVSPPSDWNDWAELVRLTIEHYSGTLSLPGVYYEVWNEPDLFGDWKAGRDPNYFELYRYAALGAGGARVNQRFYLGGPATTAPYQSWAEGFLDYVKSNNLRLDFYSWHRYSSDLNQYEQDLASVDNWFNNHPGFVKVPKIISEFGPSSERSSLNDSSIAAALEVAVSRLAMARIQYVTAFSIKDALDPKGQPFWGDWGLLTSDQTGAVKKPRYYAIEMLNKLGSERLSLSGEGSWVKGIAAKKGEAMQILLVNYDPDGIHMERVPVTISGLTAQQYEVRLNYLSGQTTKELKVAKNGQIFIEVYMPSEAVVMVEATPKM